MIQIEPVTKDKLSRLISESDHVKFTKDQKQVFNQCLLSTTSFWVGFVNNELACAWGLIPPTLLSNEAYLWLYTTDNVKGHEFLFVRHSQQVIEMLLKDFPIIKGHATVGASASIRWLKWLGAVFGSPEGAYVPFVIRSKALG